MVSDVPVGAFLSGGLDSSAIVEHMRRHASRRRSPSAWASRSPASASSATPEVAASADRPPGELQRATCRRAADADPRFRRAARRLVHIPTFQVSRLARSRVKVVLSGDGADEIFAGYDVHGRCLQRYYRAVPACCIAASRCRFHARFGEPAQSRPGLQGPSVRGARTPLRARALRLEAAVRPPARIDLLGAVLRLDPSTPIRRTTTRSEARSRSTARCTSTSRPGWRTTSSRRSTARAWRSDWRRGCPTSTTSSSRSRCACHGA
jgi:asparagine synthetase B (glutamine-hydrolysing)